MGDTSKGGGGGGGGGSSESGGGIFDLQSDIEEVFGTKDATGETANKANSVKSGGTSSSSSLNQPMKLEPMKPGSLSFENNFYGHTMPSDFKKTSIISTTGRVR